MQEETKRVQTKGYEALPQPSLSILQVYLPFDENVMDEMDENQEDHLDDLEKNGQGINDTFSTGGVLLHAYIHDQ